VGAPGARPRQNTLKWPEPEAAAGPGGKGPLGPRAIFAHETGPIFSGWINPRDPAATTPGVPLLETARGRGIALHRRGGSFGQMVGSKSPPAQACSSGDERACRSWAPNSFRSGFTAPTCSRNSKAPSAQSRPPCFDRRWWLASANHLRPMNPSSPPRALAPSAAAAAPQPRRARAAYGPINWIEVARDQHRLRWHHLQRFPRSQRPHKWQLPAGVAWVYARSGNLPPAGGQPIQRLRPGRTHSHLCPNCQPFETGAGEMVNRAVNGSVPTTAFS